MTKLTVHLPSANVAFNNDESRVLMQSRLSFVVWPVPPAAISAKLAVACENMRIKNAPFLFVRPWIFVVFGQFKDVFVDDCASLLHTAESAAVKRCCRRKSTIEGDD